MNRRRMLFTCVLLPVAFLSAQRRKVTSRYEIYRQRAIEINDLAGHIDSQEDAQKLVKMVAAEFSDDLPPGWATRALRNRIARAEYESATDSRLLIPERRITDAWNEYLEKIGAPREYFVTPEELHTLRDSLNTSARLGWARYSQNIWTIPNIYAMGQDGKVASGCRALEALRVVWDLGNEPENLLGARELIKKGVLFSDLVKKPSKPSHAALERQIASNRVEEAGRQYLQAHGAGALEHAIRELLDELFPS